MNAKKTIRKQTKCIGTRGSEDRQVLIAAAATWAHSGGRRRISTTNKYDKQQKGA